MPFFDNNLNPINMKTRNIIGGIIATIGIMVAICTNDGSSHEILIRGIGLALFFVGAYTAKAFYFQNEKQ